MKHFHLFSLRYLAVIIFFVLLTPFLLFAQGIWRPASSDGFTGRFGAGACQVGGKIYVIGGEDHNQQNIDIVEVYDPQNDSWSTPSVTGSFTPRRDFATAFVNGKIYTMGGNVGPWNGTVSSNIVEVFDPQTNTWTTPVTTGTFNASRRATAIVIGGKIYLFGGVGDSTVGTPVAVFDPSANSWSTPATTGKYTQASGVTATMVNNKVYVMGGIMGGVRFSYVFRHVVEVFDPSTNSWSTAPATGDFTDRSGLSSVVLDGKIYTIGGSDGYTFSGSVEVFDPLTNAWTEPSTSGTFSERNGAYSTVVGGEIYVIGGANYGNWDKNEILSPTAIDPTALRGVWTTASSVGFTPRNLHMASVVNGKIYVIGGADSANMPLNTLEVFDPAKNSWSTPVTTGVFRPRADGTSDAINGKIYVIGGYDAVTTNPDVDVFDPQTNAWTTLTTTGDHIARFEHSTSVIDGKIYVFGGSDGVVDLSEVDMFDPATNAWLMLSVSGEFIGRHAGTSCTFGGKGYFMCGYSSNTRHFFNSIDIFDPADNSWSSPITIGDLIPNTFLTSGLVDGKVYEIGGTTNLGLTNKMKAYDIATGKISQVVTTGHYTHRNSMASVVLDGKIYTLGGFDGASIVYNTNEIFTPTPVNAVKSRTGNGLDVSISPNPTTGIITIGNVPENLSGITVLNVLGETIMKLNSPKTTEIKIDLSTYAAGSYFIRLVSGGNVDTRMIVKQ